jgi:hypothetical protein
MQIAVVAWWGHEAFSLPLRALLYRRKKDCKRGVPYKEKWRLALESLNSLRWPHGVRIVADGNFHVRAFARAILEAGHDLIVRVPKVAAVHRLPKPPTGRRGRPRIYGDRVTLEEAFRKARFQRLDETLWGWHGALRVAHRVLVSRVVGQPCKVVCVRLGRRQPRYLLSTDVSLSAAEVVRLYAGRFSIEITFRELTQRCGFGDYQVRKGRAIEAHVQLSQVACSLLYLLMLGDALPIDQFVWPAWRKPAAHLSLGQTQDLLRQIAFQHPRPAGPNAENPGPLPDNRPKPLPAAA